MAARTRCLALAVALSTAIAASAPAGGLGANRSRHAAPRADFGDISWVYTSELEGGGGQLSYGDRAGFSFDQSIVGDFLGPDSPIGNLDEPIYYTPGPAIDRVTVNEGSVFEFGKTVRIDGNYRALVGSFADDDGKDDVFWYAPGTARDFLWDFNKDGSISQRELTVNGSYQPIVGHFSNGPSDDIVWYAPGKTADAWWDFDGLGRLTKRPLNVNGRFQPIVGQFAGNKVGPANDGIDDIFWYAPGSAVDGLWDFDPDRSIDSTPIHVGGSYRPVAGNFTGDGYTDILWYAPGDGTDTLWNFRGPGGKRTAIPMSIGGDYRPVAAEVFSQPDHLTDIVWFAPGDGADLIWDHVTASNRVDVPLTLVGNVPPQFGVFLLAGSPDGEGADMIDRFAQAPR